MARTLVRRSRPIFEDVPSLLDRFWSEPVLTKADAQGVPCYLETQTEGNVAFYRKRGFDTVLEEREPVGDLPIWFMVRPPGGG